MNYIKQLQKANVAKAESLKQINVLVREYRMFIAGPKFTGVDLDGDRKDWISTSDLDKWLSLVQSKSF